MWSPTSARTHTGCVRAARVSWRLSAASDRAPLSFGCNDALRSNDVSITDSWSRHSAWFGQNWPMMSNATEEQARLLDAAVLAGGLGARYTQPHRAYHNLMHIEDVLLRIEELTPPKENE